MYLSTSFIRNPRNETVVLYNYEMGDLGKYNNFFLDMESKPSIFMVIEPLTTQLPDFTCTSKLSDFIVHVKRANGGVVRPVKDITRKCVLVEVAEEISCIHVECQTYGELVK